MVRVWFPWLLTTGSLLAVVVILALDSGRIPDPPPERADRLRSRIDTLERQVAELREELRLLRSVTPEEPQGRASEDPPSPPPDPSPTAASASSASPEEPARFGPLTLRKAYALSRAWCDAIRQLKDEEARERAVEEIRRSFVSENDTTLLGGLVAVRGSSFEEIDREGWRELILPHVSSREPVLRRAALGALLAVNPDPADLVYWIEEAKSANRHNAESTARSLVLLADGRVEGATADAVLGLLRPETDIKAAFVMRGLQGAKVLDSRVQARLLEIVRKAHPTDYDSHYFFHFLARNLEPKSDALVDLILDRAAGGKGELPTVLSGLLKGLDDRQKERAADRLVGLAENAGTVRERAEVLRLLVKLARPAQVARLEAIASDADRDARVRELAKTAAQAARKRN